MKPKIFVYCLPASGWGPGDVIGYSLAEDGQALGSHLSSSVGFSKHDMGLTSDWKHEIYKEKYPEGFDLVWVGESDADLEAHGGFMAAWSLYEKRNETEGSTSAEATV